MEEPRAMFRALGMKTHFLTVDELGTVEANARFVAEYVTAARGSGREIIFLTSSKGGADVAHALGHLLAGQDLGHVRGWLSVGGALRGSPRADSGLDWPRRWLLGSTGWVHGWTLALARSISTTRSRPRVASYTFPAHLQVLQYVSAPFSGNVCEPLRTSYKQMRRLGPNDGVTLLPDQLLPQARVVIAVGLDHYFLDPEIDLRALALTNLLLELVQEAHSKE
jgi:hypothetical protein